MGMSNEQAKLLDQVLKTINERLEKLEAAVTRSEKAKKEPVAKS
jgi:hypothetical protein